MKIATKNDLFEMPLEELVERKNIVFERLFSRTGDRISSNLVYDLLSAIQARLSDDEAALQAITRV